jgi:hypothetical protein
MMLYAMIPLVAAIILTIRHTRSSTASVASRWTVGCLTAGSVFAFMVIPHLLFPLLQIAICIHIILHEITWTASVGDRVEKRKPEPISPATPWNTSRPRDHSD